MIIVHVDELFDECALFMTWNGLRLGAALALLLLVGLLIISATQTIFLETSKSKTIHPSAIQNYKKCHFFFQHERENLTKEVKKLSSALIG